MSVDYLDLRGEVCPMTFVHVRLWLERAPLGAELAVDVDYQPATTSIPRSLMILGQECLEVVERAEGCWRLHLRKSVPDPTERADQAMGTS